MLHILELSEAQQKELSENLADECIVYRYTTLEYLLVQYDFDFHLIIYPLINSYYSDTIGFENNLLNQIAFLTNKASDVCRGNDVRDSLKVDKFAKLIKSSITEHCKLYYSATKEFSHGHKIMYSRFILLNGKYADNYQEMKELIWNIESPGIPRASLLDELQKLYFKNVNDYTYLENSTTPSIHNSIDNLIKAIQKL